MFDIIVNESTKINQKYEGTWIFLYYFKELRKFGAFGDGV